MNSLIQQISYCGNHIYIKRDDLLPFSFGGNKARIAKEFFEDMLRSGKNCLIGYGNARSNLSRALANLCVSSGIECHLVSPADDDGVSVHTFNEKMCMLCGAHFHHCSKDNVAATLQSVIDSCKKRGLDPYYINGDIYGKGNEEVPVRAYYKAYQEIWDFEKKERLNFDYIFVPVGTGMTQAGLLCGVAETASSTEVIGISIARESKKETAVLQNYINAFLEKNRLTISGLPKVVVDDSYLMGGYGKYNVDIQNLISNVFCKFGIPLDPNYSGKAFYGMTQYLSKHEILQKNILFIHTGGVPLFFDSILERKEPFAIEDCVDESEVHDFLISIDSTLPVPLSQRVDLNAFAAKVVDKGKVLVVKQNGFIKAASLFYCNDSDSKTGYITLIATQPDSRKKGFAASLLRETEKRSKDAGMDYLALDTDFDNTGAIAMYSKNGFKIDSISKKVHMKKDIRSDV